MQKPVRISLQLERRYKFFPKKAKFFAKNHKTKRNNDPPGPFQPLHDRPPDSNRNTACTHPRRRPGNLDSREEAHLQSERLGNRTSRSSTAETTVRKLLPESTTKYDRHQAPPNQDIPAKPNRPAAPATNRHTDVRNRSPA